MHENWVADPGVSARCSSNPGYRLERLQRSWAAGVTFAGKRGDAVGVFHVAAAEDGHTVRALAGERVGVS